MRAWGIQGARRALKLLPPASHASAHHGVLSPQVLEELSIGFNLLGDDGILAFSRACEVGALQQLRQLFFQRCAIGDVGFQSLADSLGRKALPKLSAIDLQMNPISLDVVSMLTQKRAGAKLPPLRVNVTDGVEIPSLVLEVDANALCSITATYS